MDRLNHQLYANKIAEEIAKHYSKESKKTKVERDNMVFAISGRWGEGKTDVLNRIETPLSDNGFTIIKFNPWKYSQDEVSIKKAFLKEVKKSVQSKVDLDDLYYDTSKTNVEWRELVDTLVKLLKRIPWLIIFTTFVVAFAVFLGLGIPNLLFELISKLFAIPFLSALSLWIITLFVIPALLKQITTTKSYAKVTTSEEFEDRFYMLLKGKRKIVVFIDDLDRCTPSTIKIVMDAFRTFFQHPECSFVVTADHTVVEKAAVVDLQLLETMSPEQKLEKGREYIKKLFNVYWRMPYPTSNQFGSFVDDELKKSKLVFASDEVKENFKLLLMNDDLFARNPRNVIRFIDKVRFNVESLITQKNTLILDQEENVAKELSSMLLHIDLIAKILTIEEFFFPVYEKLVLHPEAIVGHEKMLRMDPKRDDLAIGISVIKLLGEDNAMVKYANLLKQSPKFTNDEGTTIYEPANYFYFSAATGLPSSLGPDPSKFLEYLKQGQLVNKLGETMTKGGITPDKNKEYADTALKEFDNTEDPNERQNIILESLKLAAESQEWSERLGDWKSKLDIVGMFPDEFRLLSRQQYVNSLFAKSREGLSDFYRNEPTYREHLWEMIKQLPDNIKIDIKDSLQDIATIAFSETPRDLVALENCLSINGNNDVIKQSIKGIEALEEYKSDISQLNDKGLRDGNLARLYLDSIPSLVKIKRDIDWVSQNKSFLEDYGLFGPCKTSLFEANLSISEIVNIISQRSNLSMEEGDNEKLKSLLNNSLDNEDNFDQITSETVKTFLNKGGKMELFKKLVEIFLNKNISIVKRIAASSLLVKENDLWRDFSIEDGKILLENVSDLKKPELDEQKDLIFASWEISTTDVPLTS
ncbi:MAG: P-loop NTPase fold protein [Microgenomates group bacterium]